MCCCINNFDFRVVNKSVKSGPYFSDIIVEVKEDEEVEDNDNMDNEDEDNDESSTTEPPMPPLNLPHMEL